MRKPKSPKVHQPDDKFFKEVMSRKESVAEYLRKIHPEISELVDLETLKQLKESFLSPDLQSFTSDIIWQCNFKRSKKTTRISFLWEHKMQEHKNYAIQAGLYIFLYLHRLVNIDKKRIEPILPLLYYNGKNPKWHPKTVHELFENTPGFEIIKKHIPNFEPLFMNLANTPPEEIEKIEFDFLKGALYAMLWRHDMDLLLENISVIFDVDMDDFEKQSLLIYYFSVFEKSPEKIKEKINTIDFKNKKDVMSAYEMLIQRGVKEGIEKGLKRGIVEGIEKGLERGIVEGIEKGLEKGLEKGRSETEIRKNIIGVKNMFRENFSTAIISKVLEINKSFVAKIIAVLEDFEHLKETGKVSAKTILTIKNIQKDGLQKELIATLFEVDKVVIDEILSK